MSMMHAHKTLSSANILRVDVSSTGLMGGDAGHGGRTVISLTDHGGTSMYVSKDVPHQELVAGTVTPIGAEVATLVLKGDCELLTLAEAFEFAAKQLRLMSE